MGAEGVLDAVGFFSEFGQFSVEQGDGGGYGLEVLVEGGEMRAEALLGDDDVHVVEVQHDGFGLGQGCEGLVSPVQVDLAFSGVYLLGAAAVGWVGDMGGEGLLYFEVVNRHGVSVVDAVGEPFVLVGGAVVPGRPCALELLDSVDVVGGGRVELGLELVEVFDSVAYGVLAGGLIGSVLVRGR